MTEYWQSLSRRTIQQFASTSRVDKNSTLSLALVCSASAGSGNAFPTDSCLTLSLQHTLSTLIVLSALAEQVAVVLSQFLSKQKGMTACSYQVPKYFSTSTQGTVLGGSRVRLEEFSLLNEANCHPARRVKRIGISAIKDLFIISFYYSKFDQSTNSYITKNDQEKNGRLTYQNKTHLALYLNLNRVIL